MVFFVTFSNAPSKINMGRSFEKIPSVGRDVETEETESKDTIRFDAFA